MKSALMNQMIASLVVILGIWSAPVLSEEDLGDKIVRYHRDITGDPYWYDPPSIDQWTKQIRAGTPFEEKVKGLCQHPHYIESASRSSYCNEGVVDPLWYEIIFIHRDITGEPTWFDKPSIDTWLREIGSGKTTLNAKIKWLCNHPYYIKKAQQSERCK